MTRIAVFGREFAEEHRSGVEHFFNLTKKHGVVISIYEPFHKFLTESLTTKFEDCELYTKDSFVPSEVDLMISIGGDGSMLDAATIVKDSGLPMLGLNTGRLGFLSSINLNAIEEAMGQLISGSYMSDKRTVLKLETETPIFGDENFALNEMTIHKQDSQSMIVIHAYVDGKYITTYWADGLIIATPTGSTAYSMSCGGPIILPSSSNFIITPVAPHNLNVRPVLISDQSIVTLRVEGRSENYLVSLDSRSSTIAADTVLTVSKNNFDINLIRLKNHSFLKTLRTKLNWGLDKRN